MNRLRARVRAHHRRVALGAPDPSLTPNAGLAAISELIDHLDMTGVLDAAIGSVKQRDRGTTGAEVLASLASCQLAGR